MLSVKQAESTILNLINTVPDVETVSLSEANGRILADTVDSRLDFPHWDNSAMDGYAVQYEDVKNCNREHPAILRVVESIAAGSTPQKNISSGEAARIFTGAMLPPGADTIVIQENTQIEDSCVKILAAPQAGAFVRYQGSFCQAGEPLLNRGVRLNAPEIAVLATAGCIAVPVYRCLQVAIISTGNELVEPGKTLKPGQIVDSNQLALGAFVSSLGCIPQYMGIVEDQPEALEEAIASAISQADVVLSTGGVSVGDYDYVDRILAQLGGKIHLTSVAVKPGKPLTVASFDRNSSPCLYFGIPGNPVSALVSCWRFVQPAIHKLSGWAANPLPRFVQATTQDELQAGGKRETYLWGKVELIDGLYQFKLAGGSHSSGNLINLAQTNGLAVVPVNTTSIDAGETVQVMLVNYLSN